MIIVAKTGGTKISNTIKLLPTNFFMPKMSSNDTISAAFEECLEALNNPKI